MTSNRLALFVPFTLAVLGIAGCGNNTSAKYEGDVMLTASLTQVPTSVNMAQAVDVQIPNLTITSQAKATTIVLSQQDDVILTQWVVTPSRTDGGTVASPTWTNYTQVYVAKGGTASVQNAVVFPAEYFQQPPLNQLWVSPFLDKETANNNIRQNLHVVIYGKELSGKSVSVAFDVGLNFFYTP